MRKKLPFSAFKDSLIELFCELAGQIIPLNLNNSILGKRPEAPEVESYRGANHLVDFEGANAKLGKKNYKESDIPIKSRIVMNTAYWECYFSA